jgi:hypothetical protein
MIAAPSFTADPLSELALPSIDVIPAPPSGQPRRIGDIMPEVLARYGLSNDARDGEGRRRLAAASHQGARATIFK